MRYNEHHWNTEIHKKALERTISNKLENLKEMGELLETSSLTYLNPEDKGNLKPKHTQKNYTVISLSK